ncbi:hypothetical protein BST81_01125 [Leptolyngbya sp. 'hensonii']|nr:hypothetical protein BST81_01125 [Leptolyngbya sp. 'hensonii']
MALQFQTAQERLIEAVTYNIRQSLDLQQVLQATVEQVQQFLLADRVIICQMNAPSYVVGSIVAEACSPQYASLLGWEIGNFPLAHTKLYQMGHYQAISNIHQSELDPAYVQLLETFEVKAQLVMPILFALEDQTSYLVPAPSGQFVWGLLIAHQCSEVRQWQLWEIELLQRIEHQLAVAIHQAELYQELQTLNTDLESQVQQRTTQLQRALGSEAVLWRITEKVRDTLDENIILQTAIRELSLTLNLKSCHTSLYNISQRIATVYYEYAANSCLCNQYNILMADFVEIYDSLLQGKPLQFCPLATYPAGERISLLACPITDGQQILGDLWLLHHSDYCFNRQEIQLVQQVANQCAIAIRQSRLYQKAQSQIQELQKLNLLKDDFLSTISHELRTPLSNIKMSTQLLEMILRELHVLPAENWKSGTSRKTDKVARCLKILAEECDREINLINDLLMLQQLDANTQPLIVSKILLQDWLPQVVETYEERFTSRQQTWILDVAATLPPLFSDLFLFNRLIGELFSNAYKFTPAQERVDIAVQLTDSGRFRIRVSNTGIEIPASELDTVFNRFYRIPSADPWKHGGTGLGLALVQKLSNYLGGTVWAESGSGQTCFTVELPAHWDESSQGTQEGGTIA